MALGRRQERRFNKLSGIVDSGGTLGGRQQNRYDKLLALKQSMGGGGGSSGGGGKYLNKATNNANKVVDVGYDIGQKILPEVFEGGSGLDRLDFSKFDKYLQGSTDDAMGLRDETRTGYDELLDMRRARLGGLDAEENQALKESLYRDIDRQRAGAMRQVARTPGLGAGASFAQQRALQRDYGDQANQASRQLLLDNYGIKRQALGDFEATTGQRAGAMSAMNDAVAGRRDTQMATSMGVDQFNAGQQGLELAARTGAFSTGAGLVKDEKDRLDAKKKQNKLLDFLAKRDEANFAQLQDFL